jgi:hypothetical protein
MPIIRENDANGCGGQELAVVPLAMRGAIAGLADAGAAAMPAALGLLRGDEE